MHLPYLLANAAGANVPDLPLWLIAPFVLLLVLIATMPLTPAWLKHRWERSYPWVSMGLGALVGAYYLLRVPGGGAVLQHTLLDYVSFIVLIGSLFVVAGGIHIQVKGRASPVENTVFLAVGAVLANLVGTTGASMVLIQPWIRMNQSRIRPYHIVFFIFLISNIGGALTPIGDPPLFLGYLRGVPFFWLIEHVIGIWLLTVGALLAVFFGMDWKSFQRLPERARHQAEQADAWRFEGPLNVVLLLVVIGAVFLPARFFLRELVMVAAAGASLRLTPRGIHAKNAFTFGPIKEVAFLFIGIFTTMMPALGYLEQHGKEFGFTRPTQYYFAAGSLSAVLDNAPTYMNFLQLAQTTAEAEAPAAFSAVKGDVHGTTRVLLAEKPLFVVAVSLGAVFFGAMTYIGNGPNFMVKSIAESAGVEVLDYYDGESKEYLMKFLQVHRKNAIKKGMLPRTRNITKMVADKSGLLFNGKAPTINVYRGEAVDEGSSIITQQILESADWIEFFTNFDVVLRLLKTAYVLVQVNPETKQFVFEILDQHNCAVELDAFKQLQVLIYETGEQGDYKTYRVWTKDEVFDLLVDANGNEEIVPGSRLPNVFGIIPAAVFHDTNVPRSDAWNEIPEDLIEINDIYNLHISDSEYSAMWAKSPTLFTNAQIQGGAGATMVEQHFSGEALPRWVPNTDPGFVGGPGTVVAVETNGESVFLDYKGPVPPLMQLDDIVKRWVTDFASDWSVSVAAEGNGTADSGFKLIVKELPNLELRKTRARMFEAGFKRLYKVLLAVANTVGISLPEDTELFVKFGAPELPIDEKASEEVWSRKIQEKRASRVDYFMEVKGMSREEALAKIAEIDAEQPITLNRTLPTAVTNTTVTV